jgi:hypothetical protein
MKDKAIVWITLGGIAFWLAILNPKPTGKVLDKGKKLVQSVLPKPTPPAAKAPARRK